MNIKNCIYCGNELKSIIEEQKINIDGLLEILLLVADMKELKSNPNKQSKGTVIEARLDKQVGAVASLLVQSGTLRLGDPIVVGTSFGKVRTLKNDKGIDIVEGNSYPGHDIYQLPPHRTNGIGVLPRFEKYLK